LTIGRCHPLINHHSADPLLAVRLSDLAHELRPEHVDGPINGARARPRVVLQDCDPGFAGD
jgi:hypothetical protein